jgi:hypothetical protein
MNTAIEFKGFIYFIYITSKFVSWLGQSKLSNCFSCSFILEAKLLPVRNVFLIVMIGVGLCSNLKRKIARQWLRGADRSFPIVRLALLKTAADRPDLDAVPAMRGLNLAQMRK